MLYPHIRIAQIFGANTDVGKTIFATILALATASHGRRVFYLKPVSTGAAWDADDLHVKKFKPAKAAIQSRCIIQMDDPVSPHLAARDSPKIISDKELVYAVRQHIDGCARSNRLSGDLDAVYIETAGGVLSPVPSGTPQADAYRPLRLPVILVGDSKLGGISSTLSAYESLHSRGYDIISILLFANERYQNHKYLSDYFSRYDIPVTSFTPPPSKPLFSPNQPIRRTQEEDERNMQQYYTSASTTSEAQGLVKHLEWHHYERLKSLRSYPKRAAKTFWYPFVQHKNIKGPSDITVVDSAHGDLYTCFSAPPYSSTHDASSTSSSHQKLPLLHPKFDGSASWWTQGVGHASHTLTSAAAYAAGRYGHVIFPQAIHEPALQLAEKMLKTQGDGWASRVFFSDNGSTGAEVALKMAMRATASLYETDGADKVDLEVLGLKGSYHGDTLGAMDACEGGVYNTTVEWYRGRGYWLDPPTLGWEDGVLKVRIPWNDQTVDMSSLGAAYDMSSRRDTPLEEMYRAYIFTEITKALDAGHRFGALVMEPLILGAAGMQFVDPLFQAVLVDTVRKMSSSLLPPPNPTKTSRIGTLPVIYDEVFSGLGRLGFPSPSRILGVNPDIAIYAKLLTGGLVPLAVTLATEPVFNCFVGEEKRQALLHGHSYTAYPVGCEVANASLKETESILKGEEWAKARFSWANNGKMDGILDVASAKEEVPGSLWSYDFVQALSKVPAIKRVMSLGTVLAFELDDTLPGYGSYAAEDALASLRRPSGGAPAPNVPMDKDIEELSVHFRTLGNVGYFISSLNSEKQLIRRLEKRVLHIFHG